MPMRKWLKELSFKIFRHFLVLCEEYFYTAMIFKQNNDILN